MDKLLVALRPSEVKALLVMSHFLAAKREVVRKSIHTPAAKTSDQTEIAVSEPKATPMRQIYVRESP